MASLEIVLLTVQSVLVALHSTDSLLQAALSGTARNPASVTLFTAFFSDPLSASDGNTLQGKINELMAARAPRRDERPIASRRDLEAAGKSAMCEGQSAMALFSSESVFRDEAWARRQFASEVRGNAAAFSGNASFFSRKAILFRLFAKALEKKTMVFSENTVAFFGNALVFRKKASAPRNFALVKSPNAMAFSKFAMAISDFALAKWFFASVFFQNAKAFSDFAKAFWKNQEAI